MHLISDLGLTKDLIAGLVTTWNNNQACVCWSKKTTTKALWHTYVQILKNAVHEGVTMVLFEIPHIEGK